MSAEKTAGTGCQPDVKGWLRSSGASKLQRKCGLLHFVFIPGLISFGHVEMDGAFHGCVRLRAEVRVPGVRPRRSSSRGPVFLRSARGVRARGRRLGAPGAPHAGGFGPSLGLLPRVEGGGGRREVLVPAPDRGRRASRPHRLLTGPARGGGEGGRHEGAPPGASDLPLRGSEAVDRAEGFGALGAPLGPSSPLPDRAERAVLTDRASPTITFRRRC